MVNEKTKQTDYLVTNLDIIIWLYAHSCPCSLTIIIWIRTWICYGTIFGRWCQYISKPNFSDIMFSYSRFCILSYYFFRCSFLFLPFDSTLSRNPILTCLTPSDHFNFNWHQLIATTGWAGTEWCRSKNITSKIHIQIEQLAATLIFLAI